MVRKYTEEELIEFLFRAQRGRCADYNKPLDRDGRSLRIVRGGDTEGKWQRHHNPPISNRKRAFGENWERIAPEMPLNMRVICLECHDYPHGGKYKTRPRDVLR